jgi:hypothetical protein
MRFLVTAEKLVFINGKINTIKAGEFETTDREMIAYLKKCGHAKKLTVGDKPNKTARSKTV